MARRIVETVPATFTVAHDESRRVGQCFCALVQGRLVDELTERPVVTRIAVEADREGVVQRSTKGGIAGLVGIPEQVFSSVDPTTGAYDLVDNSFNINVVFHGQGYLPREMGITLGPIPDFPNSFMPAVLTEDILMHRRPIIIRGRVVVNGASHTPVAGATVHIAAIWRVLPSASVSPPADTQAVMAIQPGIRFPRSHDVTQFRRQEFIPVLGEDKTLLEETAVKSEHIHCSDRINISSGDVLVVDALDPSITEYVPIDKIDGAGTVDQPAFVTLAYPMAFSHRRGAVVRRVNPASQGASNALGVDAIAGDTSVLLDSTADLSDAQTVEIADGSQPNEYRRIFPYSTSTDSGGYFQLPPLHRVAQLNLHVSGASLSHNIDGFIPDYNRRENWIDVMV